MRKVVTELCKEQSFKLGEDTGKAVKKLLQLNFYFKNEKKKNLFVWLQSFHSNIKKKISGILFSLTY